MKRKAFLLVLLAFCAAAPAAVASPRSDLVSELLRRVPQWPGTDVEIPISLYEQYVRELAKGPVPPQPPQVAWVQRAAYRLTIRDDEATLTVVLDAVGLPGEGTRSVLLVPTTHAWEIGSRNSQPYTVRRGDDGWFHFDMGAAVPYRVVATATVKPETVGEVRRVEFGTAPAAWSTCEVASDGPWDVRFSRSPLAIRGTDAGTRGLVGLTAGDRLKITWQAPQPPVHRAAQIATESHVGWTLADGVHQVRAILNLRLWGGETSELTVNLPQGADRVRISGPDVREVQTAGTSARVFLRGAVSQRSRLSVEFESPRPPTGHMTLPAFGVVGASHRGGALAIAGGAGGVLLEMDSPGLEAMALYDLPPETRGLLAAPPVYAYRVTGPWEARVDLVSMSEFPVRETLIDSALYTVLYRPDGRVMTKVIYEVRNRALQYMAVDLPPGAELVVARVSEEQKNLARGPGRTVYVPLEKSVLTTAGLVSFPVELVYVMRGEGLSREGTFRLPLPRADLPVAYARCALMLPDGMRVGEWHGVLRRAEAWSSETAELEFEYGRGHLAEGLQPKPKEAPDLPPPEEKPQKPKVPVLGLVDVIGRLFGRDETKYNAVLLRQREMDRLRAEEQARGAELDERAQAQARILQGKNLFRAGVDYYQQGNYAKAAELFNETITAAPKSLEANKARQYLANVAIALGKEEGEAKERGLRATAKAVQKAQQWGNIPIRERQKQLLAQAELAARRGDEKHAEAAYQVAVNLARQLEVRGEEAQEQKAVVRQAEKYLAAREQVREAEGKKVAELQQQLRTLQRDITQAGGEELQKVVEALVLGDVPALGVTVERDGDRARGPTAGKVAAQPAPQVELGEALAEQQVTLRATGGRGLGTGGGAAGYSYTGRFAPDAVEHLKKQVEQLKSIQHQLTAAEADFGGQAPRFEVGDAAATARPDSGKAPEEVPIADDATWAVRDAVRKQFGLQVAEKAEALKEEARKATELAREGRLAEAERLLGQLEKRAHATAGAAEVLARRGAADYSEVAGLARAPVRGRPMPSVAAKPVPPAAPAPAVAVLAPPARREPTRAGEPEGTVAAEPLTPGLPSVAAVTAPARPDGAEREEEVRRLWDQAAGLRESMKFKESIEMLDRLVAIDPKDERALRWREDLLYLEAQARQVQAGSGRQPDPAGTTTYLRYPQAQEWEALTEARRKFAKAVAAEPEASAETRRRLQEPIDLDFEKTSMDNVLRHISEVQRGLNIVIDPDVFAAGIDLSARAVDLKVKQVSVDAVLGLVLGSDLAHVVQPGYVLVTTRDKLRGLAGAARRHGATAHFAGELEGVQAALEDVTKARETLAREARRQDKVKFNVNDLADNTGNGRELAEFVTRNYSWAFAGRPSRDEAGAVVVQDGRAVDPSAIPRRAEPLTIAGGTVFFDGHFDDDAVVVQVDDGGSLVVENRPDAVANVGNVLERLRLNLGQRVGVASRNFFVDAGAAEAAGIQWKTGANGVRYAVVNEGQLRSVMDVEQRDGGAVLSGQLPLRDAYQEAVVGTDALLANGLPLSISRAEDVQNTLTYNGNTLQVTHDDYLIVDNGGYLTAVKSGRMQHWSVDVEPVRFPGVPAAVVVPTVGYTVKFEKTLLDANDKLELVADYTWEGDER